MALRMQSKTTSREVPDKERRTSPWEVVSNVPEGQAEVLRFLFVERRCEAARRRGCAEQLTDRIEIQTSCRNAADAQETCLRNTGAHP